jgi:hypothetical protein
MKHKLLVLSAILSIAYYSTTIAQPVKYSYDANGARIQRKRVSIYDARLAFNNGDSDKDKDKKAREIEFKHGITAAPNPTKAVVHLTVNDLKTEEDATLFLLDFNGKVLEKKQLSSNVSDIDLSSYANGMYFIRVLIDKENLYYKVVKE